MDEEELMEQWVKGAAILLVIAVLLVIILTIIEYPLRSLGLVISLLVFAIVPFAIWRMSENAFERLEPWIERFN